MAADPGTQNRIFLGTTRLNVSTNGGTTWGTLPGDTFTFPNEIRAIAIGPTSPNTIYVSCGASADGTVNAYSANQVYVTTNDGVTWTDRTPQLGGDFENFAVDPTNANIVYVVSANFSATGDNIWRSTNAGATWTSISATLPDAPFYDVVLDPGPTSSSSDDVLYVGGDLGVYRSTDLGTTWTQFGTGLPTTQVRDLEYSSQTKILAAATHGRGVWEILTAPPPGIISGTVYLDSNANGTRDAGEPGLAGWTVWRDDNNNGVIDTVGTSNLNSTNVPQNITDFNTINSIVNVTGLTDAVTDINVKVNITHTYDGDLVITLADPAGTKVTLFSNTAISGQNLTNTVFDDQAATSINSGTAPFTGSYQPVGFLGAFNGASPNGTWTLSVSDIGPGDTGTLNGWTLTETTGEPTVTSAANGAYQFVNQPTGTYTIRRVLQAGYVGTEPASGVQTAVLTATQGAFGLNFGQSLPPATVTSVMINDGSAQRSRVTSMTVSFNKIVSFAGAPTAAFQLVRNGPGSPSGVPNGVVTLAATIDNSSGHTNADLTFSGTLTEFKSLIDGRYTLTVLPSQITGAGLDGNGDGIAGDPYTFNLFRLFGDADGNAIVDAADFLQFRLVYLYPSPIFDFDGSGAVDPGDFLQFRLRFLESI